MHLRMDCIVLYGIVSYCIVLYSYKVLHHIASHHTTLHYTTRCYITWHYITSHYIKSHYMTFIHPYVHTCIHCFPLISIDFNCLLLISMDFSIMLQKMGVDDCGGWVWAIAMGASERLPICSRELPAAPGDSRSSRRPVRVQASDFHQMFFQENRKSSKKVINQRYITIINYLLLLYNVLIAFVLQHQHKKNLNNINNSLL